MMRALFRNALLVLATAACSPQPPPVQQMALTMDDLPAHGQLPAGETRASVAARLVEALGNARTPPVYGFVNGVRIVEEPQSEGALRIWRDAGHPLANHTFQHLDLDGASVERFEADVLAGEAVVARYGRFPRWFRYPSAREGDSQTVRDRVRRFLARRGYKVASVTLSFADFAWNGAYARCLAKGDERGIRRLEASYLQAAEDSLSDAQYLSQALYGRRIPLVLVLHAGAFNARMLPRVLALYRRKGVEFVGLEAAMADPFYRQDRTLEPASRPATLEAAMRERGRTPPRPVWSIGHLARVCA